MSTCAKPTLENNRAAVIPKFHFIFDISPILLRCAASSFLGDHLALPHSFCLTSCTSSANSTGDLAADKGVRSCIELGQLPGKQRIPREFRGQFHQLRACQGKSLLTERGHCQDDLGKGPQVTAARSGDFQLRDAALLIAADPLEFEKEPLYSRQTADDVIRGAQGKVSIRGIRVDGQQSLGKRVCLADHSEAL